MYPETLIVKNLALIVDCLLKKYNILKKIQNFLDVLKYSLLLKDFLDEEATRQQSTFPIKEADLIDKCKVPII